MDDHADTAEAYVRDLGTPFGSDEYYCVRFLEPRERPAVAALHALARELGRVPHECTEPAVAHAKLAWWREELARSCAGGARHPVTRVLAPALARAPLAPESLLELVAAFEEELDPPRYPDFEALHRHCLARGGTLALLEARVLGAVAARSEPAVRELGAALRLAESLAAIGGDVRRGYVFVPGDELAAAGVTEAQLRVGRTTPAIRALLERHAQRAGTRLQRALDTLPPVERRALRAGRIRARLALALLAEIRRDDYRLLERRVTLTPIRRLWIAWRTSRRSR